MVHVSGGLLCCPMAKVLLRVDCDLFCCWCSVEWEGLGCCYLRDGVGEDGVHGLLSPADDVDAVSMSSIGDAPEVDDDDVDFLPDGLKA